MVLVAICVTILSVLVVYVLDLADVVTFFHPSYIHMTNTPTNMKFLPSFLHPHSHTHTSVPCSVKWRTAVNYRDDLIGRPVNVASSDLDVLCICFNFVVLNLIESKKDQIGRFPPGQAL